MPAMDLTARLPFVWSTLRQMEFLKDGEQEYLYTGAKVLGFAYLSNRPITTIARPLLGCGIRRCRF